MALISLLGTLGNGVTAGFDLIRFGGEPNMGIQDIIDPLPGGGCPPGYTYFPGNPFGGMPAKCIKYS